MVNRNYESKIYIHHSPLTIYHLPRSLIAKLYLIHAVHSVLRGAGGSYFTAAREVRRWRSFLQQRFEYSFWPARHGEHSVEGHHWRRRGLHAHRANPFFAGRDRISLSFAVDRTGADTSTGAAVACCVASTGASSGSFTCTVESFFAGKFAEVGQTFLSVRL